jgi:error-prone DNA polymerase
MFVELHARSAFSFLEAAALPEALAERAAALGQSSIALLDADGVYGAPRLYRACTRLGITARVGAEVTLADGSRLPLLVEDREGYQNLCRLLTRIKMRAPKGEGAATLDELAEFAGGLVCLTGGGRGPLAVGLEREGVPASRRRLERLVSIYGRFNVFVELQRHLSRPEEARNEWLRAEAGRLRLQPLATNEPRLIARRDRPLLDALTCIREHVTLETAGRRLARNSEHFMKSGATMERLFADYPEAVANTGELALRLGFTLKDLGYRFPEYPLPRGETPIGFLRELAHAGARTRYGGGPLAEKARRQIEHELALIGRLDLAGYFLIVWDLVQYCGAHRVLVQGRGSAANSAVCYALGLTAVDPVGMELLFERFLSEERGEWPDIDLDLPSGDRREQVIQYVYERYGRLGAAMTANVISYRGRSAAREIGKVLGLPADVIERLSQLVSNWEYNEPGDSLLAHLGEAGCDPAAPRVQHFARLWSAIQDLPRHLGQHSGGMVIAQGRLDGVVPLEPATMPGRSVVQWDKDDCAALGIVKVDLLGLGMMSLLQDALEMIRVRGGAVDLAHLPQDPTVYRMLQEADTIGVFQVESRAQMATLPRLRPTCFYDLVVQVAIIRPGPIVGDMVHPYLRRRAGREEITVPHPDLEPILRRTLGVPLFQEQLLRMAMATAGFTGGEAEELRRAFGFKRSERAMKEVEVKLRAGMARQGISGEAAEAIIHSITAFALYGFPECVAGDARVIDAETGRGVRIADVVEGRAALTHTLACDADLKIRPRRVLAATASGSRMVYRLRTFLGREVVATPEHLVLTETGWRPLGSLQFDDHVATAEPEASCVGWDCVLSVDPEGMSPTYDLAVEDDHNFVADGLIVHNSHAASFALLAYASAYLKAHHPAAFYAALLNNQPMGFYDPATIVNDAGRHGQVIHPADVNYSGWLCAIEPTGSPGGAVRLGLRYVRGLREEAGRRLEAERTRRPFASVEDLVKRGGLRRDEVAQLARVGALASLEPERRAALWEAERAGRPAGALYEELAAPPGASPLRPMTAEERLLADYEGTGLTLGAHPMAFRRGRLLRMGVSRAADLAAFRHGAWVKVAGAVVVRQRPGTAKGFVFLNLEDETGLINVIVRPALFHRHRLALVNESFLLIEGTLQRQDNVTSVRAERLAPLRHRLESVPSHDFH